MHSHIFNCIFVKAKAFEHKFIHHTNLLCVYRSVPFRQSPRKHQHTPPLSPHNRRHALLLNLSTMPFIIVHIGQSNAVGFACGIISGIQLSDHSILFNAIKWQKAHLSAICPPVMDARRNKAKQDSGEALRKRSARVRVLRWTAQNMWRACVTLWYDRYHMYVYMYNNNNNNNNHQQRQSASNRTSQQCLVNMRRKCVQMHANLPLCLPSPVLLFALCVA